MRTDEVELEEEERPLPALVDEDTVGLARLVDRLYRARRPQAALHTVH